MSDTREPIKQIPEHLRESSLRILRAVEKAGGRGLLVGGCVRDALRGVAAQDLDIEVFGLPHKNLEKMLSRDF